MATTGSKTGSFNGSTASCASLIAEWSYTQDINKNTTALTVYLKVKRLKSGTTTHKSSTPYSFTVDGTTKSGNYNFDITSIAVGNSKTIATITKTLTHNADGTYKAISISGKFDVSGTTLGVGTVSASLTLNTIPRSTTPKVSATSVDMGSSVMFTLDRASSAFTHKLTYSFEGVTGTIGTDIATSKSWTVPNLASNIPDKISSVCTITCTTYNGSTVVGSKSLTMTLKVPKSVKPTVTISISEAVAEVASKLGVYVKNLSKLNIEATGSGASGSTITSHTVKANGNTYNTSTVETEYLNTAGDMTITATVTDSRGRTGSASKTINVVDYVKPLIRAFKVERTSGSNVNAVVKCGITDITGNTPVYKLEYKKKSEETYTLYTISDTTVSIDKTISLSNIDPNYQYIFRLTVSDQFNSNAINYDISTEFTLMDINASGKGIAFGKVSEGDELEITLPFKLTGEINYDPFPWTYVTSFNCDHVGFTDAYAIKPSFRKIGNHVYVRGYVGVLDSNPGGALSVFTLPPGYRPIGSVIRLNSAISSHLNRVVAKSNGDIVVDWIKKINSTSNVTGAVGWVLIDIDFFTD